MTLWVTVLFNESHQTPELRGTRMTVRALDAEDERELRDIVQLVEDTPGRSNTRKAFIQVSPLGGGQVGWLRSWEIAEIWTTELPARESPGRPDEG